MPTFSTHSPTEEPVMTTKRTDIGDMVLIETVASFGGQPPRTFGGVLIPSADSAAVTAEVVRQATEIRRIKSLDQPPKEPVV